MIQLDLVKTPSNITRYCIEYKVVLMETEPTINITNDISYPTTLDELWEVYFEYCRPRSNLYQISGCVAVTRATSNVEASLSLGYNTGMDIKLQCCSLVSSVPNWQIAKKKMGAFMYTSVDKDTYT